MSIIRFTGGGNFKVEAGVEYVKATIDISWQDSATSYGLALKSLSFSADNRTVEWSRSDDNYSGSADRTFTISGNQSSVTEISVNYTAQDTALNVVKKSDTRLVFLDGEGDDANVVITLKVEEVKYFAPVAPPGDTIIPPTTTSCPQPTEWVSILPVCGSPPRGLSSQDGLQISRSQQNQITLNLKNYVNKLVTLKIIHYRDPGSAWTQTFDFSIPNCSDVSWSNAGTPYARPGYSNRNINGTNIFYVYNVDGGDYNYVFNHSSDPGPRPERTAYNLVCTESTTVNEDGSKTTVQTCNCVAYQETYGGSWPNCPTGVAVSKNGGDRVQWQFEDGGGGDYNDQKVTVEVVSVRDAIGSTGPICTSALKNNVWIPDPNNSNALGNCISNYLNHPSKIRFRIPSLKASKNSFNTPLCYSDFRGIAGAAPPGTPQGSLSSEYSIVHVFNRDLKYTESLAFSSGVSITQQSESDDTIGTLPDPNLNIATRRHYLVQFTDGTTVSGAVGATPGNVNVIVQTPTTSTADGLTAPIVVSKVAKETDSSFRVWFYAPLVLTESTTRDVVHAFNDETNTTITTGGLSNLQNLDGVTIVEENPEDPGGGTLDGLLKKHYTITFTDSTIIEGDDASNIDIRINKNQTASGLVLPVGISKKARVTDKVMRVWFTAYNNNNEQPLDNSYIASWSISRNRTVDYSGNQFVRSWNIDKVV